MAHQYYVYMTTNLINGKNYIGKRKGRLDDGYIGSGKHLKAAIRKYGEGSFRKAILEVCRDDEHAYIREAYWVDYHDAVKNPNFYNLVYGGEGFDSGENHPMYGKTLSDETRRKISEAMKGEKNPRYGKPRSTEFRRKLSEVNKGKTISVETRRKMSEVKRVPRSDITRERISEMFTMNPKIPSREAMKMFNISSRAFYRILGELYDGKTFSQVRELFR
jgi:group I intron endonuclease